MKNLNPWLLSGFVLTISGITFRWWLGNSIMTASLALILALSVVPLVQVAQATNCSSKAFKTYKLIGGFISILGLTVSAYFNIFSLTSPNPRFALVGSFIFVIGLAVIIINHSKSQISKNGQA